jgi:glucose-1-phosphate cytidylyltransferase
MKILILAGGLGTRLSEETTNKPKPMVLIGDKPIIWHIMKIFAMQGFDDFIIATGYKSEIIEEWVTTLADNWNVQTVYTGLETQTGGRIRQCMSLFPDERFIVTYGDGVGNVNIAKLINFHVECATLGTITAVHPPARFGYLDIEGNKVTRFGEKNQSISGWINGGFFVIEPEVSRYIHDDSEPFETGALPRLVQEGQLMAYQHSGYWQPMDTLRERNDLTVLANTAPPPWFSSF